MRHRLLALFVFSALVPTLRTWAGDAPTISAERIKADVAYFANDRLEGRGPGTRGEELTIDYRFDKDVDKVTCKCGTEGCRGTINLKG